MTNSSYVGAGGGGGGGFTGVLDGVSNLMVAFSTRRLRSAHTGNLIDCRRAGDSGIAAIGNDGTEGLDTATLVTHVTGQGNGFISKYYDQSGNSGRDAALSVTAKQFRITSGTTVLLLNGHAVGYADGDSMGGYTTPTFTAYTGTTLTALCVWQWQSVVGYARLISCVKDANQDADAATRCAALLRASSSAAFAAYRSGDLNSIAITSTGVTYAGASRFSGSACNLRQGSNTAAPASSGAFDINRVVLSGLQADTGTGAIGYWCEAIVIAADATDAVVQTIQANQRTYWGAS